MPVRRRFDWSVGLSQIQSPMEKGARPCQGLCVGLKPKHITHDLKHTNPKPKLWALKTYNMNPTTATFTPKQKNSEPKA
jgi:hypothetical protein